MEQAPAKDDVLSNLKYFRLGLPLKPPYCNSGCKHCYVGELPHINVGEDLYEKRKSNCHPIAKLSRQLGLEKMTIVGTEPTLEEDIIQITDNLFCYDLTLTMSTNGWLTGSDKPFTLGGNQYHDGLDFINDIIYDYHKFGVVVSLDGIGETNDRFRGVKGGYERAIRTLQNLKRKDVLGTKLASGVEITIHQDNIDEIPELIKTVTDYDLQLVKFNPLILSGKARHERPFTQEERERIRETLADIILMTVPFGIRTITAGLETEYPMFTMDDLLACPEALAPKSLFLRNVPYDVSFCGFIEQPPIGTMDEKPLAEILSDLKGSWVHKVHRDIKEKGIEEVSSIVDKDLRERVTNLMCEHCLVLSNVYMFYDMTGDREKANMQTRKLFGLES